MLNALKRVNWRILKFILFNSALPALDVGTDVKAFLFYLSLDHLNWATLTATWIVVPFCFHLAKFLFQFAKTRKVGREECWDLFLHIPFVLPLRNLYYAYRLYRLDFGTDELLNRRTFDPEDWLTVEEIQRIVAKDGLSECYFESGQAVINCFQVFLKATQNLLFLEMPFFCNIKPHSMSFVNL